MAIKCSNDSSRRTTPAVAADCGACAPQGACNGASTSHRRGRLERSGAPAVSSASLLPLLLPLASPLPQACCQQQHGESGGKQQAASVLHRAAETLQAPQGEKGVALYGGLCGAASGVPAVELLLPVSLPQRVLARQGLSSAVMRI